MPNTRPIRYLCPWNIHRPICDTIIDNFCKDFIRANHLAIRLVFHQHDAIDCCCVVEFQSVGTEGGGVMSGRGVDGTAVAGRDEITELLVSCCVAGENESTSVWGEIEFKEAVAADGDVVDCY